MLLDNTKNGFILKSNFELKKAYILFKVISSRTLTNLGKNLLELSLKLKLPVLFIVRATVFRQFCSGENLQESYETVKKLNKKNVKSYLHYSVEGLENEKTYDNSLNEVVKSIDVHGEMHRFIPVFAQSVGASIQEVPVKHHPRKHGESKYNLSRTFRVLLDLITVRFLIMYNTKPLYFFGKFAFASLFFCLACWTWTVIKKIMWGYPLYTDPFFIFGGILLVLGIQLLLMGLLAEMMVRIYYESQGKNSWILRPEEKPRDPDG